MIIEGVLNITLKTQVQIQGKCILSNTGENEDTEIALFGIGMV